MLEVINMMSPQDALVASMILMSAADRDISQNEMREINAILDVIPVFKGYDTDRLRLVASAVEELIQDDDGLDAALGMIRDALPDHLHETAYALACDVAAADGAVKREETRLLEMIRHTLHIDRLIAAGIERGARARHQKAPSA
jgi:tellurite resistance protein